jgi:hypothetical protein
VSDVCLAFRLFLIGIDIKFKSSVYIETDNNQVERKTEKCFSIADNDLTDSILGESGE